jgi:hypothetical protein
MAQDSAEVVAPRRLHGSDTRGRSMRQISFSMTTEQIRNRTKTVTCRLGWANLKPGALLQAVAKGQGLKKGEKVEKLCIIRVKQISLETLKYITRLDVLKEGFPHMNQQQFIAMFTKHNRCGDWKTVTRIEFEYFDR